MKRFCAKLMALGGTLLVLGTGGAWAQTAIPHAFVAGDPARAAEVNENFTALAAAIDANGTATGTNTTGVATNATAVSANAAKVTTLETAVAALPKPAARTIFVPIVPGDTTASGTALLDAMASISGSSWSNPYLIRLEPGRYDLGASTLTIKDGVEVEGASNLNTWIQSNSANPTITIGATVAVTQLRAVLVWNFGANGTAISITGGTASNTVALKNIFAGTGGADSTGVAINGHKGVLIEDSLINSGATTGVWVGVKVTGGGEVLIRDTHFSDYNIAVSVDGANSKARILGGVFRTNTTDVSVGATGAVVLGNSEATDAKFQTGGGTLRCYGSWNPDFITALPLTCLASQ